MTEDKNPIDEGFMARRTILLVEDINAKSVGTIIVRMMKLQMESSEPIHLIIDSPGGVLNSALQLCDFIENIFTAPVYGTTVGRCSSAATFIMLSCHKRRGTRNSTFLIHSGRLSGDLGLKIDHSTPENLELLLKDLRKDEEKSIRHYMNHLTPKAWRDGKPSEDEQREFVRSLLRRGDQNFDQHMTAEEAVEVGLIEEIVEGKLDIFAINK